MHARPLFKPAPSEVAIPDTARTSRLDVTMVGGFSAPQASGRGLHAFSGNDRGARTLALPLVTSRGARGTSTSTDTDAPAGNAPSSSVPPSERRRATVLPISACRSVASTTSEVRDRFDRLRQLGRGGMGEVELVRDNDIQRNVAVKRLNDQDSEEALLRFAEEVRTIGQLEHPGIVPVYDVGRDDDGKLYLVMKHLEGESMEGVITALRERHPDYLARFTIEYRIRIFLGVLDAMRYAHARGILHRDLKPANIQIGPYGEVTVIDWGIAKPLGQAQPLAQTLPASPPSSEKNAARRPVGAVRLAHTQLGALAGTPLYMSPEQAAGQNDDLDERSDIYALGVILFEWLTLVHPRGDKSTLNELLSTIIHEDYRMGDLQAHARRAGVPLEYLYVVARAVQRDREARYRKLADFENHIRLILDGRVPVQCHVTLAKRTAASFARFVDQHLILYTVLLGLTTLGLLGSLGFTIVRAL